MLAHSPAIQPNAPISFAPVFVKNLCNAVNPWNWRTYLKIENWKKTVLKSGRTLQISSRTVIRDSRNIFSHFRRPLAGTSPWFPSAFRRASTNAGTTGNAEPPLQNAKMLKNIPRIAGESHTILKRTDEKDPEKLIEINLNAFDLKTAPKPGDALRINQIFERQATLPKDKQMLWRHSRGVGDDPASKIMLWRADK